MKSGAVCGGHDMDHVELDLDSTISLLPAASVTSNQAFFAGPVDGGEIVDEVQLRIVAVRCSPQARARSP
jgi:hypothetical protein